MDIAKRNLILEWVKRISQSKFSIANFFTDYDVPFSKAQYFIYKKQLEIAGPAGLTDGRERGGNRKLSPGVEGFLLGCVKSNSDITLEWLQKSLQDNFNCSVSLSSISRAIKRISKEQVHLPIGRRKSILKKEVVINPLGGFEIIVALAFYLGWPQRVAELISSEINELKNSDEFKSNVEQTDRTGRDKSGKFTKDYNQREDVRANRFASISEKRKIKNWQSLDIVRDSCDVLIRKSLAILALPAITMNGSVRTVNVALGNSLRHICGFNYKQNTVVKYLNELKYLGISTQLLKDTPQFWRQCWGDKLADSIVPVLCYYVDGNTKAVWSSKRVKKNKVTMLGRVMGCLEQVFIHDCFGHPIYFETFSGHGPVGEHILGLFEKVEDAILDAPHSSTNIYRAIVMDSASNSAKTLRAFAAQQKYHYVTPLDDNQWNERKVVRYGRPSRYRYGNATLKEMDIELEDSNEKGWLIRSRAIKIDWDYGKVTVLLTNLPLKIIDASEVVWSYFQRWPAQELQFRYNKAAVALNHVAGYGRKEIENPRVIEAQQKAERTIENLGRELAEPVERISVHENAIADLILKERRIRAKGTIKDGRRLLPKNLQQKHDEYGKQINDHFKKIKEIEKENDQKFKKLKKNQREWLRLQGKEKIYEIDVELDQIVTFHRISLANLLAYFIQYFLSGISISMGMMFHQIIHLQASIEETNTERKVELHANEKDPDMMQKLSTALEKLNQFNIHGPKNKLMRFSLV
jgi:hypothetical protein